MTKPSTDTERGLSEKDWFLTIETGGDIEIKVLGSRFLAYAFPARTAEEFGARITELKKQHYSATHHCYAYRIGADGDTCRFSDDGEPNGTAGKRILGAIDRHGLTDVAVVVVRYFGGTKLGVGRLGHAYRDAALEVIAGLPVAKKYLLVKLRLTFHYDHTSTIHRVIETFDAEIIERRYGEAVSYDIRLRESRHGEFLLALGEKLPHTVTVEDTGRSIS